MKCNVGNVGLEIFEIFILEELSRDRKLLYAIWRELR